MPTVEIDDDTDQYLDFAARVAGISKGEVVARLIRTDRAPVAERETADSSVAVHADYQGHRTHGEFVPGPNRLRITSGPLAGQVFRTPSEAARKVVEELKPGVSPHRNGWSFWLISSNGAPLQAIRHRSI